MPLAVPLVCDQYLIGADGKPLRGPGGQFFTTTDLARAAEAGDPFQHPAYGQAYGYATGRVVGGVLVPAVDPVTGVPLTGLFQSPCSSTMYLDANCEDEAPTLVEAAAGDGVLGFDGLLARSPWPQDLLLQPRGAPDVFVDGAFPASEQAVEQVAPQTAGHIERLLRDLNLGDMENSAVSEEVSAGLPLSAVAC